MPKLPKHIVDRNAKASALVIGCPTGDQIKEFKKNAKLLTVSGKVFSNGQTGCMDGVYLLENGNVLEVFLSHYWMPVAVLFESQTTYFEYDYIAYHVYFESAFN